MISLAKSGSPEFIALDQKICSCATPAVCAQMLEVLGGVNVASVLNKDENQASD